MTTCCYHGNREDDVECCICSANPCDRATDDNCRRIFDHHWAQLARVGAACERAVNYAITHGKREEAIF